MMRSIISNEEELKEYAKLNNFSSLEEASASLEREADVRKALLSLTNSMARLVITYPEDTEDQRQKGNLLAEMILHLLEELAD